MSCLRRALLPALAVVLTGTGLSLAAAPADALRPGTAEVPPTPTPTPTPATVRGVTLDTDWGDGAHGQQHGRVGPKFARTTTVNPATGPDFEVPFPCGQRWIGSTRSSHSPSAYAIDWNAANDFRQPVLASAPGVVTKAVSLRTSYGRYVVVDHGSGFTTLYAHMDGIVAPVGQYVDQGDLIGYLGSTGNSTGPHLHYEQRVNGAYFKPYFHRATFRMGSTATSANCADKPVSGDWDGDGTMEMGIFRPAGPTAHFWQRSATGALSRFAFGAGHDRPVVGDFDGDRLGQAGVRKSGSGNWWLRSASGAMATVNSVGYASDVPTIGDWDGNGRTNLGVYRPSTHTFWLRSDTGSYTTVVLGLDGDRPVVGDWNGDGRSDVGMYRPSTGYWYLRVPSGTSYTLVTARYGLVGDIPIPGDWNGDGTTDLGIWRSSTSYFWQRMPTGTPDQFVHRITQLGRPR